MNCASATYLVEEGRTLSVIACSYYETSFSTSGRGKREGERDRLIFDRSSNEYEVRVDSIVKYSGNGSMFDFFAQGWLILINNSSKSRIVDDILQRVPFI